MRSNYKRIGDFIQQLKVKNKDDAYDQVLGINIDKFFMPSVANIIGTDLTKYKVVGYNQFACNRMHVGRDYRIPIALSKSNDPFIVSPAYTVFEITDTSKLYPEYLMMWFSRAEFDREAWFHTDGDVRGGLPWNLFCDIELPVPSIEKQRAMVKEYNTIVNRIKLNEQLNQKLEETAQTLYKHWFVDFEFPDENGQPYKSSGGEMVYNEDLDQEIPEGWLVVSMQDLAFFQNGYAFKSHDFLDQPNEKSYDVFKMGHIKKGGGFNQNGTKNWVSSDIDIDIEKFLLRKGDILMAMTDMKESIGLLGNTALMPKEDKYLLNQRVGLLRIDNSYGIGCNLLYTLTNSKSFLRRIRNTANYGVQVNLTSEGIRTMKILIAKKNINTELENKLKTIQNQIDSNNNINNALEDLNEMLLKKIVLKTEQVI